MIVSFVEFTDLLQRVQAGDRAALDAAIPLVYGELKKVAANHLRRESKRPLETTALVHETYLKMAGSRKPGFESRSHFFAIASALMRQILVDHARSRHAKKREGITIELAELGEMVSGRDGLLLDVDSALDRLSATDERKARLIEMRYFGGMTVEESAEAMGLAPHTARRELRLAHAWLHRELAGAARPGS
jgi:RNA polymerase sigma factor (TIGR02999 family)